MCMQPKMCTKCKKNLAVVFITKIENGATLNEGYCLKCTRSLGIPQIDAAVQQMGFSDEDLDNLTDEMSSMFGQMEVPGEDGDEIESQTATFPLLNQLFGSANLPAKKEEAKESNEGKEDKQGRKKSHKHKFLDSYCMNLPAEQGRVSWIGSLDVMLKRNV